MKNMHSFKETVHIPVVCCRISALRTLRQRVLETFQDAFEHNGSGNLAVGGLWNDERGGGTDISQSYNQIFQLDKKFVKELLFRLITYRAAAQLLHHAKHELRELRKLRW